MIAYRSKDKRAWTKALFMEECFDSYYLREAVITTYNLFTIDGRSRLNFYTDEELESEHVEEYSYWKKIRPICYELIKGKKLPIEFKITLMLSEKDTEKWFGDKLKGIRFIINFRYKDDVLMCVSACAYDTFTMNKDIDVQWDTYVGKILSNYGLDYEIE